METMEQRLFRFLMALNHIPGWATNTQMHGSVDKFDGNQHKTVFEVMILIGKKESGGYTEILKLEGSHDLVPMLIRKLDEARLTKAERDQLAGILPIFTAPQENG